MKFDELAASFERIEKMSSRLGMMHELGQVLKKAHAHEASIICNISLGQLHPPYIGTQFNMAEKMVLKTIAQFLGHSDEVIAREAKAKGDVGVVVGLYEWKATEDMTVLQVYKELCALEQAGGEGSQEGKVRMLKSLLEKLTPSSAKFVVRIVIGKLRLGFSDMTLVDALSWMETGDKSLRKKIEDAYNVCADIGAIAQTLKEKGQKSLEHYAIHVGIPILPAAAERLPSAADIIKKLGHCVAQPKLDGFRLQVHYDHAKHMLKFFSRNLLDMTGMFPDLAKTFRSITGIKTLICEGEAIGYDANTDSFLPFQETVKRKRKHGVEQAATDAPLRLFLFDILYLNGHSLLDDTHEERRKKLLAVGKHFHSENVQIIKEHPITTAKQLQDYFLEMINMGLEGLVVKRPDAIYQAGKRNFNWIKLKKEAE
ncbi:MAG TPA: ATP-dependent DNA ligase, partial [Candidatus Bathyarchaeia archaeon]|nr:ATP-dependent DNA ligase [Candidatus Bathyarchaeia archaeon]